MDVVKVAGVREEVYGCGEGGRCQRGGGLWMG